MRRISIDDLIASQEELARLRDLLGRGGVAAVPTETFYALAADPFSEAGVRRVFEIKGREEEKPLPVLFATRGQFDGLGIVADPATIETYFRIWPAPLTVVFQIRDPIPASRGRTSLAVRMPGAGKVRLLLGSVGAITGTSLNRSGGPPLDSPNAVEEVFREEIHVLVDGGETPGGKPSTIVDATRDAPVVLRRGAFPWAGA